MVVVYDSSIAKKLYLSFLAKDSFFDMVKSNNKTNLELLFYHINFVNYNYYTFT